MYTLHAINFIVARGRFSFAIIGSSFGSESSKLLQSSGDITAIVTYDVLTTAQPHPASRPGHCFVRGDK